MNEPIISPWLIYWAGRIDMIHHFCIVAGVLLTMLAGISMTTAVTNIDDCDGGFGNALLSFAKKLTCVALIVDALAMYVTRYITPATIKATGEFTDKAVDKLIEKIAKASKAVKE